MVDISHIITCANFGEDRLRGLGVAGVKVCPFSLTLIVALTTLALVRVRDQLSLTRNHGKRATANEGGRAV